MLTASFFTSCKKEDKLLKHSNENSLSQGFDIIHKEKVISKSLGFSSPSKDSIEISPHQIVVISGNTIDSESYIYFENAGNSPVSATLNPNYIDFSTSVTIEENDINTVSATLLNFVATNNSLAIKNNGNNPTKVKYTIIKNKYEVVGYLHNELLDYLAYYPNFLTKTEEEKLSITEEFVSKIYQTPEIPTAINVEAVVNEMNKYGEEKYILVLKNRNEITVNEKNALQELFRIGNKSTNTLDLFNKLQIFNTEITNNENYNEYEKIKILCSSATLQYSYAYWGKVIQNTNHPLYNKAIVLYSGNNGHTGKMKPWAADLLGAGIGAGLGFLTAGPGGAIWGALVLGGSASLKATY